MSAVFRTIDDGENVVGIIKFNVPLFTKKKSCDVYSVWK